MGHAARVWKRQKNTKLLRRTEERRLLDKPYAQMGFNLLAPELFL